MAKYYRLNNNILASELRVIDADGTQLGIIGKDDAIKRAEEQNLDLIEIAPNAKPPVAKILDFEKFKYEEHRRQQAAKKHSKDVEIKELWFTPRIAQHDIDTRLKRMEQFLADNNKVMIRIKFRGREMAHTELGYQLLNRIFAFLGDRIEIEREPKLEGRSITVIIGRATGKKETKQDAQAKNQEVAI